MLDTINFDTFFTKLTGPPAGSFQKKSLHTHTHTHTHMYVHTYMHIAGACAQEQVVITGLKKKSPVITTKARPRGYAIC